MKTNQKYTQEEMYIAIELWHKSHLSQPEFCKREGVPYHIFLYWLKKYRKQKGISQQQAFIPVEIKRSNANIQCVPDVPDAITINYPNGVQVLCPAQMSIEHLKGLIKL